MFIEFDFIDGKTTYLNLANAFSITVDKQQEKVKIVFHNEQYLLPLNAFNEEMLTMLNPMTRKKFEQLHK